MATMHHNAHLIGTCSFCSHQGEFHFANRRSVRSDYCCAACGASLRFRDQAAILVDEFGKGVALSVRDLINRNLLAHLYIYEASLRGPFTRYLRGLPNYVQSYYWNDLPLGAARDGINCQDLRRLTFHDELFDLILTSDVLEHVFKPEAAFREIYRVLKPGGMHVFTIPIRYPFLPHSVTRAEELLTGVHHLTEAAYHIAGDGSKSLVVTDFGADLVDLLTTIGYRTAVVRRSAPLFPLYSNATFVCRRPG